MGNGDKMNLLLSICIPTYNRINELTELIDLLLTIKRNDFEIVITDNQSTDQTREQVLAYTDKRVRYFYNEKPLPALLNMIHSLYNGVGKYVLYCNDRDLLYPDEIVKLMGILQQDDYSFVHSTKHSGYCSQRLCVFEKGYESIMEQSCNRHPSGMVFNRRLIEKYVDEKIFEGYLQYIYTYDFMMYELFRYEKSAFYHCGYWDTRPVSYLREHKAGTGPNLYFLPENKEKIFHGIVDFIFDEDKFQLDTNEKQRVIEKLYEHFTVLFCNYKLCMSDVNETAHYGLEVKHISTLKMIKIYRDFLNRSVRKIAQKQDGEQIIKHVNNKKCYLLIHVLNNCVKINVLNVLKFVKNKGYL